MTVSLNRYLGFSLIAITNELSEQGMWSFVQRWIINVLTNTVGSISYALTITNMTVVQKFEFIYENLNEAEICTPASGNYAEMNR
jgi:hypothetical protein